MRILTGLQPSGKLHVGNYFGAMEPAVRLQDQGEAFYFIADYHAMTSSHNADALRENVRELAIDFLACGLDPAKAVFFRQSAVPEVNELAWILSTICPMSLLAKCHSYKDKTSQGIAPNHALFAYPVLMAADILLYDSNKVPVGKDQKQHIEVTRDITTSASIEIATQGVYIQFADKVLWKRASNFGHTVRWRGANSSALWSVVKPAWACVWWPATP
jgi:tryptophanyl-tRNA synthetase